MRKQKVLIDFSSYSDSGLAAQAQSIETAMTGNANFTTPTPPLTDLTAAITAFNTAMTDASTGDHTTVEIKNQKRKLLEVVLHQLALYVEAQSAGDVAKMRSSHYNVSKEPAPVGPLPKPTGFKVVPGGKGEVGLALDKLDGASSYQFEYKLSTATDWINKTATRSKILLTNLESGKEHSFRVVPIGTSDIREYSDEISSFVL